MMSVGFRELRWSWQTITGDLAIYFGTIFSPLKESPRFVFKMSCYHDAMHSNNVLTSFGSKTAPQHQRSSTVLNKGHEVLFQIFLSHQTHMLFVAEKRKCPLVAAFL
ncbi:hypothetical protein GOODEAATRI_003568 [Goodea atripinnis]|uniref:Uncharacterized protein n=1 Tax=Goodea atripinnis TaxID=208336 RepID=A0ABV0PB23_9TELE